MFDDRLTYRGSGARYNVQHARRESCFDCKLAQLQDRKWSAGRRLYHGGISHHQCRSYFRDSRDEREIPWRNQADDTQRLADCHGYSLWADGKGFSRYSPSDTRHKFEMLCVEGHIKIKGFEDRPAVLHGFKFGPILAVFPEEFCHFKEKRRLICRRDFRPFRRSFPGRFGCSVNLHRTAFGSQTHNFAVGGINNLHRFFCRCFAELSIDQYSVLGIHSLPPCHRFPVQSSVFQAKP